MGGPEVGRHYRDELASEYLDYQRPYGDLSAKLDLWKFEPHIGEGDVVVDFGCGGGALLAALHARERVGIEPSTPARREARERGLRVVSSPAELDEGYADVVISNHALEHAPEPFTELSRLRRLLRPGGRLVLYTPIDDWRSQRAPGPDPNHHLHTWTPLLMRNLLEEAGFEVTDCRVVTHAWPPRPHLLSRLPRPLLGAVSRAWSILRRRRQVCAVATSP